MMAPMTELRSRRHRFLVREADEGLRLDQLLAARVEELSRRQARVVLDLGGVFVDRKRVKTASRKLKAEQSVEVFLGGALERASKEIGRQVREKDESALPKPRVFFRDRRFLVVEKPSGLLTAPTPESDRGNLVSLLQRDPRNGTKRLFVVHRLDLETSGVLVLARGDEANRRFSELFREHDLVREYLAVLAGAVDWQEHHCTAPVGGKEAGTRFRVEERFGEVATLVRATLETGRTHQIRLHARALGHPVLGDRKHGRRSEHEPPRLALHAERLAFRHPFKERELDFRSKLPKELGRWLAALRKAAASGDQPRSSESSSR